MGLNSTIAKLTQTAIKLTGDLKVSGTYVSVQTGAYDAENDTVTDNSVSLSNVPIVISKFAGKELEASKLTMVDANLIIAALDLPGITPKETDKIVAGGRTWQVINFNSVPGTAVWILPVREG